MRRFAAKLGRFLRRRQLKRNGAAIGGDLQSCDDFFRGAASGFTCGNGVYISEGARLIVGLHHGQCGRLILGRNVFINHYAVLDCQHQIELGANVLVGPHAYIGDFDHQLIPDGSISGIGETAPVRIGDNVWIGANATVLKGVTIDAGAVVAAGAVVTGNVPSGAIVGGVPARILRYREGMRPLLQKAG